MDDPSHARPVPPKGEETDESSVPAKFDVGDLGASSDEGLPCGTTIKDFRAKAEEGLD